MTKVEVRDVANYLLNHCYIMGEVEETRDRYYYAINHLEELKKLFIQLGYTLAFHPAPLKIIMLVNEYEGTQAKLSKYESIVLLICRLLYLQKREKLHCRPDGGRQGDRDTCAVQQYLPATAGAASQNNRSRASAQLHAFQ